MRLYCVDGTNVVRVLWGYGGEQFREQEESDCLTLVESFAVLCRGLAGRAEVEIFFDGEGRRWKRVPQGTANLRVRFSWEELADALILDRVRAGSFGREGRVTVVTADGELGRRAREEGGRWLAVRHGEGLERVLRSIEGRFAGKE
ncbi:MAG: NYN domain-containing protein [Elusimicrobia bacterium]|nr:NYN domain-containing protein [Elusimicrobiota bacterium]